MTLQMKMMEIREEGRQEGREEGRQEGREEGREEGRQEGEAKGKTKVVIEMLRDNAPLALIKKYTQVSAEQIAEIARSIGVTPVL